MWGTSVSTTLDTKLQQTAYDALGDRKGAVVVMEPDTGKILAMVSKPDFNPNTISDDWDQINADANSSILVNRATQGQYPPGSTFKIITALAYWRQNNTFDNFPLTVSVKWRMVGIRSTAIITAYMGMKILQVRLHIPVTRHLHRLAWI